MRLRKREIGKEKDEEIPDSLEPKENDGETDRSPDQSRMTQFLKDRASDSEEVVTPLMLDGTYLSRNYATLGPLMLSQPTSR